MVQERQIVPAQEKDSDQEKEKAQVKERAEVKETQEVKQQAQQEDQEHRLRIRIIVTRVRQVRINRRHRR